MKEKKKSPVSSKIVTHHEYLKTYTNILITVCFPKCKGVMEEACTTAYESTVLAYTWLIVLQR